MKKQEVLDLITHEFNGLNCDVSVQQQDGHFAIEVKSRAFESYSKRFNYVAGMTRAEIALRKQEMVKEVFRGVPTEIVEAKLRSELEKVSDTNLVLRAQLELNERAMTKAETRIAELETQFNQPRPGPLSEEQTKGQAAVLESLKNRPKAR